MGNRAKIRFVSYTVALLAVMVIALAACHVGAGHYETHIDAQYARSFGEALNAVERLDTALNKSAFASGSSMESAICAQIYSDAQCTQTALSTLPVQLDALEQLSKQISVLGDYAFTLSRSAAYGASFSEEELRHLSDFSEITHDLYEQLELMRQAYEDRSLVHEKRLKLTDALNNLEEETASKTETLDDAFHKLQEKLPEAVSIVYDGQYTDHSDEEQALEGAENVTEEQAMKSAADFLGADSGKLLPLGRCEGDIPCWRFSVSDDQKRIIDVTVNGGTVVRYLSNSDSVNPAASHEKCVAAGKAFLEAHGYSGLIEDDTSEETGGGEICFVSLQDDVVCFPDRIVMRINPASKELLAYDASAYLQHHHSRTFSDADLNSLQSSLPDRGSVSFTRMAVLSSPNGKECYCAEFLCRLDKHHSARLFVNAETGQQQLILLPGEKLQQGY